MLTEGGIPERSQHSGIQSPQKRDFLQKGWNSLKKATHPIKEYFGYGDSWPTYKQRDRRGFLKEVGVAAAGLAGLGGLGYAAKRNYDESPEGKARYDRYPKPEGMPEDILTKEELQRLGITIYQTPNVQLYLRRGVFDLPLFKDAEEKRIKGVVISLIDSDSISWNSTSQLPKDARAVWQGTRLHPSEYSEDYWEQLKKYDQDMIDYHQKNQKLKYDIDQLQERTLRSMIDYGQGIIKISTEAEVPEDILEGARKIIRDATDTLQDLLNDKKKKEAAAEGSYDERQIDKFKHELGVLRDRPAAIEYMADKGNAQGQHIDVRKDKPPAYIRYRGDSPGKKMASMFHDNPQWDDKVYLYLCVSGDRLKPKPEDSLPGPGLFETLDRKDQPKKEDYDVFPKDIHRSVTGFFMRHEATHYEADPDKSSHNERDTDHLALDTIAKAYDKYQKTGDTSGYPFVFVTEEGITITKNRNQQQTTKTA